MRKLRVFNNVTLDGYFAAVNPYDFSWAQTGGADAEFDAFVAGNARGEGELVFGRITYELMASYWPTPAAMQSEPVIAAGMNNSRKVVFSRTLDKAAWQNTRLLKGDLAAEIRQLKDEPGPDMTIMGSGSIISQLTRLGLIDEYQLVVNPVLLGQGRTMFEGVSQMLPLKLTRSRAFGNGKLLLSYEPG